MATRITISVTNDLSSDQRVHRVAETLVDKGYEVLLVGRRKRNSKPLPDRRYATRRMALLFESGKLFYLEHAFRLFWLLLFRKTDILLANDLDTLLANFLVARLRRKRLVYDSHEYFTEVPELLERRLTRSIWLLLERWTFPRVDTAYTVNQSLADIYQEKYGIPVHFVRNLPLAGPEPRLKLGPHKVLIYQGALNMSRGIELMIEAMRELKDYTLWVVGTGDLDGPLHKLASTYGLDKRVIFKGFVHFEELKALTAQAHLGLSLEQDRGASYHNALPNKLFDYIQAGIPVLVSDLPEMRRVVEEYGVGECLHADTRRPEHLVERIRAICENEMRWQQYHLAAVKAAPILTWENEKQKLDAIFPDLPA